MSFYGEYSTLQEIRATYLNETNATQDTMLFDLLRSTSREMDNICNRRFVPWLTTQYYDTPRRPDDPILFTDDLLELTTLTNGDGNTFTTAQYKLYPLNAYPKHKVIILPSSELKWYTTSTGDPNGAISAAGVYGYHDDYTNAWQDTLATLSAAITTTSQTTVTCTTGKVYRGYLVKIDSEYIYINSVTVGSSDTLTMIRGVNGSTAATHLISTPIYRWTSPEVEMVCRVASVAYFKLRANPVGDSVVLGGQSFATPKDVTQYMDKRLRELGLIRTGIG